MEKYELSSVQRYIILRILQRDMDEPFSLFFFCVMLFLFLLGLVSLGWSEIGNFFRVLSLVVMSLFACLTYLLGGVLLKDRNTINKIKNSEIDWYKTSVSRVELFGSGRHDGLMLPLYKVWFEGFGEKCFAISINDIIPSNELGEFIFFRDNKYGRIFTLTWLETHEFEIRGVGMKSLAKD